MSRSVVVLEALARLRWLKRSAERLEARLLFTLRGERRSQPLTEEQIRNYHRDGYLLVAGLVPADLVVAADAAMWESLDASPVEPTTWHRLGPRPHLAQDPRLLAIYTGELLAAAAQLAGEDVSSFLRPPRAFTVNRAPGRGPWRFHEPHLDRSLADWRYRTFPRAYRIAALTYLTDVPHHGGGTIVWPGSHRVLENLARAAPLKYRLLSTLNADLNAQMLGTPVELTPSRGDVLFHDYLCVHTGSENLSDTPRLALDCKW